MIAVQDLWYSFHQPLHKFILKRVKNNEVADDILQDVFLKLLKTVPTLSHTGNIKSYVYTTANHAVMDYFRTSQHTELKYIEMAEENPLSEYQLADCCLRPMIESLPAIYRDALIMVELDAMSQKDFAAQLNLTYSAAKSRVQRARQLLKEILIACCNYQFDRYGNIIDCCNWEDKKSC
jgi:RNA polymerase sigma-70 factor (ECF subfamily)